MRSHFNLKLHCVYEVSLYLSPVAPDIRKFNAVPCFRVDIEIELKDANQMMSDTFSGFLPN